MKTIERNVIISKLIQKEPQIGSLEIPWDEGFQDLELEIGRYLRGEVRTTNDLEPANALLAMIGEQRLPIMLAFVVSDDYSQVRGIPLLDRYDKKNNRLAICEEEYTSGTKMSPVSALAGTVVENESNGWSWHDHQIVIVEANLGENRLNNPLAIGHLNWRLIDEEQGNWIINIVEEIKPLTSD